MSDSDQQIARAVLASIQPPKKPAIPVPPSSLHEIYYESSSMSYQMRNHRNRYIKLSKADVFGHLVNAGLNPFPVNGALQSEVELAVLEIQQNYDVDFVGSLAGYRKGLSKFGDTHFLVTTEPTFVVPV